MTGVISILNQQLAEAQAQDDLPRQVALAVALLKERVSDNGRIQGLISHACATLASASDPTDLTAALGWYQTWYRHCRSPAAKAGMEAVQERITRVQDAERVLRDAITVRDVVALRAVLTNFAGNPDRLSTTTALVDEGQALHHELQAAARRSWSERVTRAGLMRARLRAAMPGALDHAMVAWQELLALDPTVADDPELADLPERANQARNRQRLLEAALNARALGPLEEAYAAMMAATDRLSDSAERLDRALVAQSERRARLEQLHGELAGVDRARLDLLVPLSEELAAIDPAGPAAASLAADRRRLAALSSWRQTIVAGETADLVVLEGAVSGLASSAEQLADSAELISRGRAIAQRRRDVIVIRLRRLRFAVAAAAAGVVLLIGVVARDSRGFAAIAAAGEATAALAAAERYHAGWHLLHHAAAGVEVARLQDEVMTGRLAALTAMSDPELRLPMIEAELLTPLAQALPTRHAELIALRQHTRLELDDRAFATATAIPDLSARIAALSTYITSVGDPARAEAARATLVLVERERDVVSWQAVTSATAPEQRLAAIAAYLALPAPRHAAEAERKREETLALQRSAEQRAADEREWARIAALDGAAGISALEGYLQAPAGGHLSAARERLARLLASRDDAAWAVAAAAGDDRPERLRAYLAGPAPQRHRNAAGQALAALAWAAARSPEDPAERLSSLQRYLAAPPDPANATEAAYRAEAQAMVAQLPHQIDAAAWERARTVEAPAARIAAIQAYLAGPGEHDHRTAAVDEAARTARSLIDSDPALVASLSRLVLDRVPAGELARLAPVYFAHLPATLRARLPATTPWSAAAGVDDYGRWAVLAIGEHQVRLRYLVEGQVQITTQEGVMTVANAAPCWMAESECTQALWSTILGGIFSDGNPSRHRGPELPVHRLGRDDCRRFLTACNARLAKDGIPAQVALPTAAQWRFAAFTGPDGLAAIERGTCRSYDARELVRLAHAQENGRTPAPVGGGRRDQWGLADLLGNVSEWCGDELDGSAHWRGGSWRDPRAECRPERAQKAKPDEELEWVGLRLMVIPLEAAVAAP